MPDSHNDSDMPLMNLKSFDSKRHSQNDHHKPYTPVEYTEWIRTGINSIKNQGISIKMWEIDTRAHSGRERRRMLLVVTLAIESSQ